MAGDSRRESPERALLEEALRREIVSAVKQALARPLTPVERDTLARALGELSALGADLPRDGLELALAVLSAPDASPQARDESAGGPAGRTGRARKKSRTSSSRSVRGQSSGREP